ncbi:MAG: AbrB/MazE/SpoVT family DNA-binding domain-containing protein [Nitrospira sp.]
MNVKIDQSSRIVVPKPLRDRLGLKPGMALEVQEHADGVFLRVPIPHSTMVNVDGLLVHPGTAQANADWVRVLEDVREERLRAVGSDRAAMPGDTTVLVAASEQSHPHHAAVTCGAAE